MAKEHAPGTRCISNAHFASQFPRTIARNEGKPLTGIIIGKTRQAGVLAVKWDTLATPWRLHTQFLTFRATRQDSRP